MRSRLMLLLILKTFFFPYHRVQIPPSWYILVDVILLCNGNMSICITTIMAQIFLQVWGNTIQKKLKMISPCMTWHVLYVYYLRLETWFTAKQFPRDLNFRSLDKKNRDMANGKLYCRKYKVLSLSLSLSLLLECLRACKFVCVIAFMHVLG